MGFHTLCAEFLPELDAVETPEFGLSIALQESGMNARTEKLRAKNTIDEYRRERHVKPDEGPMS